MATLGLKYVAWGKMATEPADAIPTYNPGIVIGRAVAIQLAIANAEGELYADDALAEYAAEFSSGALTMEVDNITLQNQSTLYGANYSDDELQFGAEDNAPYGGIGGYQTLMVGGVRKYRAWFFPKAKAAIPDWNGTTKGKSISFSTQPMKLKVMAPDYGPWYYVKEFTTEAAAKAYIDNKLGVATTHKVLVQVQGADSTEGASPVGENYASGTFVLNITGTPTALYDNGVESKASIGDGKYTLSTLAADHTIAVIF